MFMSAYHSNINDDDVTIITSNATTATTKSYWHRPLLQLSQAPAIARATFALKTRDAIADSVATQIFNMEGTQVINKRQMTYPLKVMLADGCQVILTHMCDIRIEGLPVTLTRHIIPGLSITLLFGIRVLTKAGCKVTFNKLQCVVWYNGKVILRGAKDVTTNLWTLPIGTPSMISQHNNTVMMTLAAPGIDNTHARSTKSATERALITHMVQNKAKASNLHTNICVAPEFWCYWRPYRAGTSKSAPISLVLASPNIWIQAQPQLKGTQSVPELVSKAWCIT